MAEAVLLQVVVGDLAHRLGPQRLPGHVLAGVPAVRPPGARPAAWASAQPAHGWSFERVVPVGLELVDQLAPAGHAEPRGHADVVQRPAASYRPSSSEPTPAPSLWVRKPATTQSAVRWCLTLTMARLSGR